MTIIVAVKKNNKVAIGADSFWGGCYHITETDKPKLIEFDGFVCAIAGLGNLTDVLLDMKDTNTVWKVDSRSTARAFAKEVFKRIKEDWSSGYAETKELADAGLIIATSNEIYTVEGRLACITSSILTDGAGWELAKGAIGSQYDYDLTARQLVEIGIKTACKYSPLCKEPFKVIEV